MIARAFCTLDCFHLAFSDLCVFCSRKAGLKKPHQLRRNVTSKLNIVLPGFGQIRLPSVPSTYLVKTLPIKTKIGIRLYRNRSDVLLMVDDTDPSHKAANYGIKVHRVYVEALRFKLAPNTISYLENAISSQVARFFLPWTEMRYLSSFPFQLHMVLKNQTPVIFQEMFCPWSSINLGCE